MPVKSAPRRWPPKWLAFYHTKVFEEERYTIQYYGRVREIRVVKRRELFPNEFPNPKSDREYYQVFLASLERLPQPICSAHSRRIVFIPTTWHKFMRAQEVNDLFDESPLEDRLWQELKKQDIPAERQWYLPTQRGWYALDFAVFCAEGNVDIETDGDTYHTRPERTSRDNRRFNALQSIGWRVLRFNGSDIRERMAECCIPEIMKTIGTFGGVDTERLVPRQFFNVPEGVAQQLSLFEEDVEYDLD